ncbi:MAG: GTPase ObgE [Planctomycetota bacterium]
MFIDAAHIFVRSGKGGDGCVSFRRQKYIPKGGPDGGNGGDGGSVILVADPNVETLLDFTGKHHWYAPNGEPGRGKQQWGKKAPDLEVMLPPGTQVFDDETDELLLDLAKPGQRVVICEGGRGGFGNEHFKTPVHQTPREATPGEPGEEKSLRLELKLVADVGLLGKPNAGKSTLLSAVSAARPKIADYPFTTLIPQPGVADLGGGRRLVICDIPGLIEGAASGAGLGHRFLRHVERTAVLVHLLDADPGDGSDPVANYRAIRDELAAYSPALADKPEVVVLSKVDLLGTEEDVAAAIELVADELGQRPLAISSATKQGLDALLETVWNRLNAEDPTGGVREPWSAA